MYKKYYIFFKVHNLVRFSIAVLPSLSAMMLYFGLITTSNLHPKTANNTQDSISIQVAGSGSSGSNLFIDLQTNQIYATYIKTQNIM
jgi:hypothetical protein